MQTPQKTQRSGRLTRLTAVVAQNHRPSFPSVHTHKTLTRPTSKKTRSDPVFDPQENVSSTNKGLEKVELLRNAAKTSTCPAIDHRKQTEHTIVRHSNIHARGWGRRRDKSPDTQAFPNHKQDGPANQCRRRHRGSPAVGWII